LLIGIGLFSCRIKNLEKSKKEMRQLVLKYNTELGECFKSGDAEKLSQLYTDSAKLCPNGYDFVIGRENIKVFWAEDFKTSRVIGMNTQVLTVDGTIDVIYETGIAESKIMYNDSLYNARVKYINVWRKQPDGTYLLDIDFWNKPGKNI
jgi:ketosteroid isomerase-like protein